MQRIYARNKSEWKKLSDRKWRYDRSPSVQRLEDGIILPVRRYDTDNDFYEGGVCDSNFNFVAGFLRHGFTTDCPGAYGVGRSYAVPSEDIVTSDKTIIFGGCIVNHFGHFILEGFARLWYVMKSYVAGDVAFVIVRGDRLSDYHKAFLNMLGISEENIVVVDRPTKFKKIIIPEESVHSWDGYMKEYMYQYEFIRSSFADGDDRPKKIYLTRTKYKTGIICVNEEYFEDFFRTHGYEVIAPETLPLEEQMRLLANADEVATTMGSLSHLALFCKPGTKFICLTRVGDNTLTPQCLIHEATNVDWYIVDVSLNFFPANRMVGVNLLGTTIYWKEFVYDMWHEIIEEDTIPQAIQTYLKCFFECYNNKDAVHAIKNIEMFSIIKNIKDLLAIETPCITQPVQDIVAINGLLVDKIKESMILIESLKQEYEKIIFENHALAEIIKTKNNKIEKTA